LQADKTVQYDGILTNDFKGFCERRDGITCSVTGGQQRRDQVEHVLILHELGTLIVFLFIITGQNKLHRKADGSGCKSERPQPLDTSWPASYQKVLDAFLFSSNNICFAKLL